MSTLNWRYLTEKIKKDLQEKMVFLGGPRQVGKTTFAQNLISQYHDGHPGYLNWDSDLDREKILKRQWPATQKLIVLDEIHKFAKWRNTVKGFFDTLKNTHQFLITGSARLDYYRKGGDSLLGRYYYYRLHPLSLPELKFAPNVMEDLLNFGGFPEVYFKRNDDFMRRWHLQRLGRIIKEDLRDLENVKEITLVQALAEVLPERVGSPLSVKNLAEDIAIDFKTADRWVTILENLYYCYRISPFGAPKIKAVKKERKLYLWDWSQVPLEGGHRFENLVAGHLLKFCHYQEDVHGHQMELRFLRDTEKREVDFVVMKNKKPLFAVECKTGEKNISPHIIYFEKRTNIPKFYQIHLGNTERVISDKIHLLPFEAFCKLENLV